MPSLGKSLRRGTVVALVGLGPSPVRPVLPELVVSKVWKIPFIVRPSGDRSSNRRRKGCKSKQR